MRTKRSAASSVAAWVAAFGSGISLSTASLDAAARPEASPAALATNSRSPDPVAPSPPSADPELPSLGALPPVEADDGFASGRDAGPFSRHKFRLSLLVGTGSTNRSSYLVLGGGFGFFIADGFEVGIDYEDWLLGEPIVHRLSPETRYVFHFVPVLKPYVGAFYRHAFVNDFPDLDHLGVRTGLYYVPPTGNFYLGGGAAYERLLNCKSDALVDCNAVYPEILIGISI